MNKDDPFKTYQAYSREVIYATLSGGDESEHSLDYISEGAERLLGYNPGQTKGKGNPWISSVHPDDRES